MSSIINYSRKYSAFHGLEVLGLKTDRPTRVSLICKYCNKRWHKIPSRREIFHSKSFPLQTPSIIAACVKPSLPSPPSYGAPIDLCPSKHHLLFGAMHCNQSVCVAGQEGCYLLLTATGGAVAVATVTVWLVAIWLLNEAVSMWKVCVKWSPIPNSFSFLMEVMTQSEYQFSSPCCFVLFFLTTCKVNHSSWKWQAWHTFGWAGSVEGNTQPVIFLNIFMEISLHPHLYYLINLLAFGSFQIQGVKKKSQQSYLGKVAQQLCCYYQE